MADTSYQLEGNAAELYEKHTVFVKYQDIVENCIYRWKSKYGSIKMAEATQQ